jgi:hypothetical protein
MNVEERLRDTLRGAAGYEPSPDLWERVERSISEDHIRRRRLVRIAAGAALLATGVIAVALAALTRTNAGVFVDWRTMQALEILVMAAVIVAVGPAVRRFGEILVADVFRASPATGRAFLAVLDVAFYLVTIGYVLVTTRLDRPGALDIDVLARQLGDAATRVAGLLLTIGVLHVAVLFTLPILGVTFASGWRRADDPSEARPIPVGMLIIGVIAIAAVLVGVAIALLGVAG